jgi:pimeloyl-ACP methyl ester carboxylesterase
MKELNITICFLLVSCPLIVSSFGLHHHYALKGPHDIPAGAADPLWFQQKLDHFNPQDQRLWPQKYFVNSTFYKSGGPVFFLLGGEGPLSPSSTSGSHFILTQYAQQYNALIVAVEHRFYGDSIPFNDSSTPNLRYLTTLQALADFANFRSSLPSQPSMQFLPSNATWIVFGGSYSGSLSAWARLKYPHLFHGSLAASAPVHAQTDFPEYFEVVAASIGPVCATAMAAGTASVEKLLDSAAGRVQLQRYFNTCTPILTDDDAATFMGNLASVVSGVVQYNRDNNNYMPEDMETMCSTFLSISDTVQSWVNLTQLFSGGICMEVSYDQTIKDLQPSSAGRSWTYQTCTEYGYFQTGELDQQPFSKRITLDYFLRSCKDAFGVSLKPDTNWM